MSHKLRGLGELVAYLPYVLGFVPARSVVVVGVHASGLGPVSRVDVPSGRHGLDATAHQVADQLARADIDHVDVLAYDDGPDPRPLADALRRLLHRRLQLTVQHEVVVTGGRWTLRACRCGRDCAVGEPTAVPAADRVPAVADRVLREERPAASREELLASLAPAHPALRRRLLARAEEYSVDSHTHDTAGAAARAWGAVLDVRDDAPPVHRLPDRQLLAAMSTTTSKATRDELMGWIAPEGLSLPELAGDLSAALDRTLPRPAWRADAPGRSLERDVAVARVTARLGQLLAATPEPWVAGTGSVLAYWAWSQGSGALAGMALHRVLDADPEHALARLLLQLLSHGMRPQDLHPEAREIAS